MLPMPFHRLIYYLASKHDETLISVSDEGWKTKGHADTLSCSSPFFSRCSDAYDSAVLSPGLR